MLNKTEMTVPKKSTATDIISLLFGILVLAAGLINTFWGNDMGFGVMLVLISFIYLLPVNTILKNLTGYSIPKLGLLKILLGIFIIWATLGVGELFNKIELMLTDFQ